MSSIDEAFGEKADLYRDVLRVKSNVSTEQIQQAYFNRRDEIFHILTQMDQIGVGPRSPKRYQVERQMEAVVMSLRVLGDPDIRMKYDAIRRDRVFGGKVAPSFSQAIDPSYDKVPLGISTSKSNSDNSKISNASSRRGRLKSALKKGKSEDDPAQDSGPELSVTIAETESEYSGVGARDEECPETEDGPQMTPARESSKSSSVRGTAMRETRKVTPPRTLDTKTHKVTIEVDDMSQSSQGTTWSDLESRRTIYEVVQDEIFGVFEDTSRSVEQVLSAFTLQDDDIQAVFGRIDKAKQQMTDEFTA